MQKYLYGLKKIPRKKDCLFSGFNVLTLLLKARRVINNNLNIFIITNDGNEPKGNQFLILRVIGSFVILFIFFLWPFTSYQSMNVSVCPYIFKNCNGVYLVKIASVVEWGNGRGMVCNNGVRELSREENKGS